MATRQQRRFYGWVAVLAGGVVYLLVLGFSLYGFSVIFPTMVLAIGWSRADAALAHTIRGIMLGIYQPGIAQILNRIGARSTMTIGALGVAVVVFLISLLTELWHWWVLWGLLFPLFYGMGSLLPAQTLATLWFNIRRGLAMGIVLVGGGIGGFLASPILTAVMEAAKDWRPGWVAVTGFCLVGAVVAVVFIRSRPADLGQSPDGLTPEEAQAAAAGVGRRVARTYRSPVNWTLRDAIGSRSLWLLVGGMIGWVAPYNMILVHSVLYLRGMGYGAMEAAFTISLITGLSAPTRFLGGWLADRIEGRFIYGGSVFVMFLAFLMLWFMPAGNLLMLYAYAALQGLGLGSGYVVQNLLVGNYWGPGSFATINGTFVFPISVGVGALVPVAAGWVFDTQKSYNLAFVVLSVVNALGAVSGFLATPPTPKEAAQPAS